jgi:hypothetical protein
MLFSSAQYALQAVAAFLFLLSYFGNKFISTNFVHGSFITHQLQALPLALFVSVIQLEFLGIFKIMVIPNIRFLVPVFYKLMSSNQQLYKLLYLQRDCLNLKLVSYIISDVVCVASTLEVRALSSPTLGKY